MANPPEIDTVTAARSRRADGAARFATVAVSLAVVAFVAMLVVAITQRGGGAGRDDGNAGTPDAPADDGAVADRGADAAEVVAESAAAMAAVTSVQFRLERGGAPIFIDEFGSIALDSLLGQFAVPSRAQAELTVTVDGNLTTRLGAIALDDEVWISEPVTGNFETLPPGYDIDPSKFFDPEGGWQPLLANLRDVELVGVDDRGGERYHVRGTAPAEQVREITVGLVRDQDVPVDLWIHPSTHLVTAAELTTTIDGDDTMWALELERYGDKFTIEPPVGA